MYASRTPLQIDINILHFSLWPIITFLEWEIILGIVKC